MVWQGRTSPGRNTHVLAMAAFLGLFGFSPGACESTDREMLFGSVDCPETLSVQLNHYLSRPPYVEKKGNTTGIAGGLFKGMVSLYLAVRIHFDLPFTNAPGPRNVKYERKRNENRNITKRNAEWREKRIKKNKEEKNPNQFTKVSHALCIIYEGFLRWFTAVIYQSARLSYRISPKRSQNVYWSISWLSYSVCLRTLKHFALLATMSAISTKTAQESIFMHLLNWGR